MTQILYENGVGKVARATCERCGVVFEFPSRYLYNRGFDDKHCADCKAKPQNYVKKNGLKCRPWHGDFDLDQNLCLKDGKPYMVGPRSCGNADCIRPSHIIEIPVTPEQPTALLNGKVITFEQFQILTATRKAACEYNSI